MSADPTFTAAQLRIAHFCAEECRRQRSGELSVGRMLAAWTRAAKHVGPVTPRLIAKFGQDIEPTKNVHGFRRVGVYVLTDHGPDHRPNWADVPRLIAALCQSPLIKDPAEWYHQFELIHPFVDGNGRTGKVMFNLLRGTLHRPQWPPDFFGGIANP